jgi:aryl-phospho-beta-D-glucosidase BglC (GH1 family)
LQDKDASQLTADFIASSPDDIGWDDNPATFEMTINVASPYHGEYQLANGWGPEEAPNVFQHHWEFFITESDFEYLSGIGINTVRIPVGYWIASDPNPPKPFVAGSLQVLDNAFDWAE